MRDLAFLINPVSGGGVGREVFQRLGEVLDSFDVERASWTAEMTDPDRLGDQIDGLLGSARKLIAVGGDGTMGLVLDRVRRRPSTVIGLIPLGTGNDLGRALGIHRVYSAKGLIACLKRLLKAPSRAFDLWDVGGRATMVSYLSAGLDAAVLRSFDRARKRDGIPGGAFGNRVYYICAFFAHLRDRLPPGALVQIDVEGKEEEIPLAGMRTLLLANIDSYAAGSHPFPENRFDDGRMEFAAFDSLWKYALVVLGSRLAPPLLRGLRRWWPRHSTRKITLTLPAGTPVQLDGEDFTDRAEGKSLVISWAARVQLLDLRRSFYALF